MQVFTWGMADGTDTGEPITVRLGDLGTVVVQPRGPEWDPEQSHVPGPPTWLR